MCTIPPIEDWICYTLKIGHVIQEFSKIFYGENKDMKHIHIKKEIEKNSIIFSMFFFN